MCSRNVLCIKVYLQYSSLPCVPNLAHLIVFHEIGLIIYMGNNTADAAHHRYSTVFLHSVSLISTHSVQHPIRESLHVCSSLKMSRQGSHQYKKTHGKPSSQWPYGVSKGVMNAKQIANYSINCSNTTTASHITTRNKRPSTNHAYGQPSTGHHLNLASLSQLYSDPTKKRTSTSTNAKVSNHNVTCPSSLYLLKPRWIGTKQNVPLTSTTSLWPFKCHIHRSSFLATNDVWKARSN